MHSSVPDNSKAALERLIQIAQSDTGQSRIVANFLLAWWNAAECGGFDLTDVWGVDRSIAADMLQVFALVAGCRRYPDTLGYSEPFERPCVSGGPDRGTLNRAGTPPSLPLDFPQRSSPSRVRCAAPQNRRALDRSGPL